MLILIITPECVHICIIPLSKQSLLIHQRGGRLKVNMSYTQMMEGVVNTATTIIFENH